MLLVKKIYLKTTTIFLKSHNLKQPMTHGINTKVDMTRHNDNNIQKPISSLIEFKKTHLETSRQLKVT